MSDPEETIRFPNNITLVAPKSVWNQHALMADIVDWNASDVPSTESLFTDGEEPLSPLVRLTPEHTSFTTPVTVMFPACIGATRVWRSSESSWELVELESFENGCVTTSLSHFCHCFASGNSRILKAIGYIKPHSAVAKLALACVGRCHQCNHALEQYQEDYYFLEGYQPCTRPAPVGTCEDTTSFRVTQGAHQQTLQVSSRMCPAISDELQAQGTQFKVQIEDIEHTFKCDAATHGDVTISGASSSSQQRPSSSEPLGDVTQPSSATMSSYFASFLPSFLLVNEDIPDGSQAPISMISARFDKGEMEMKFRRVHELLKAHNFENLMVDVGGGDDFGAKTLEYLGRLDAEHGVMLAVCTENYGEMTSSPYSSNGELTFALNENVRVLPLKVVPIYPPRPPSGPDHPFDKTGAAKALVKMVLPPCRVFLDCCDKSAEQIAKLIAEELLNMGK
ncbi:unnamed protein product [Durusdinium trenchii]